MIRQSWIVIFVSAISISFGECCELNDATSTYQLSENGKVVVGFDRKSICFEVKEDKGSYFLNLKELTKVTDLQPNIDFAISSNSDFLMVQFDASEYEHKVSIYSIPTKKLVSEKLSANAVWAYNKAVLVPYYNKEDLPEPKGLVLIDPENGSEEEILRSFAFTGRIVGAGNFILADYLVKEGDFFETKRSIFNIKGFFNK